VADSINLSIALRNFAKSVQYAPSITGLVPLDIMIPAGTVDMSIPLTGLLSPEFLVTLGARGISVKRSALDTPLYADPMMIMARTVNGLGLTSILVSNSDTENHEIFIVAGE